jgi:hypothetical protein
MEYEFPTSESFNYLGAVVTENNYTTVGIKVRIAAGNMYVHCTKNSF